MALRCRAKCTDTGLGAARCSGGDDVAGDTVPDRPVPPSLSKQCLSVRLITKFLMQFHSRQFSNRS